MPSAAFDRAELESALPRLGLHDVRSIRPLRLGNPDALKAVVETGSGRFLVKLRVGGLATPDRVRTEHAVQTMLEGRGVPVALPGRGVPGVCEIGGRVYELLRYVEREPGARPGVHDAGRLLALIHASPAMGLPAEPPVFSHCTGPDFDALMTPIIEADPSLRLPLESLYHDWSLAGDRLGVDAGTGRQGDAVCSLLHGDYHPANLVVGGGRVRAVLDFEAAHAGDPDPEFASAAALFSLQTGGDPAGWPETPDTRRLAGFAAGYASLSGPQTGRRVDPIALPWLMIRGLIAQAMTRAHHPGGFGGYSRSQMIPFISRTCGWMREHADGLGLVLADELPAGPPLGGSRG